jgi:xylulokinase
VSEATSLGAAILGGLGAGVYPDVPAALERLAYAQTTVEPVAEQVALYEAYLKQVYQKIYPSLRSLHQTIYDLQHPAK